MSVKFTSNKAAVTAEFNRKFVDNLLWASLVRTAPIKNNVQKFLEI